MRKRNKKEETYYKPKLSERVVTALDLPEEIVLDLPKLTFVGNKELVIENYKGILEYTDSMIKLNTSAFMLKISGKGLEIRTIVAEEITVAGRIAALEFIQ